MTHPDWQTTHHGRSSRQDFIGEGAPTVPEQCKSNEADDLISRKAVLDLIFAEAKQRDDKGDYVSKLQGATAAVIHNAIRKLPAAPQEAEPVAWRWRRKGADTSETSWDLIRGPSFPVRGRLREDYDVEPLYTHPAPVPAVPVADQLRMIVSHATMGQTDGAGMSVNEICVLITSLRNELYDDAKVAVQVDWPKEEVSPGVFVDVDPESIRAAAPAPAAPVEGLLTCPFCGGQMEDRGYGALHKDGSDCPIGDLAIDPAKWNRRAQQPAPPVKAMREMKKGIRKMKLGVSPDATNAVGESTHQRLAGWQRGSGTKVP